MTKLIAIGTMIVVMAAAAVSVKVTENPSQGIRLPIAVFGRTMRPTPPPFMVDKRTSLSGEGVFIHGK